MQNILSNIIFFYKKSLKSSRKTVRKYIPFVGLFVKKIQRLRVLNIGDCGLRSYPPTQMPMRSSMLELTA
jgi:hypothetical protein